MTNEIRSLTFKNAIDIFKRRAEKNPELKEAYIEEKKKYKHVCKMREYRNKIKTGLIRNEKSSERYRD